MSKTQQEVSLRKVFRRHNHRVAQNPTQVTSINRRDLGLIRSKRNSRWLRWFAITIIVVSVAIGAFLLLSELI